MSDVRSKRRVVLHEDDVGMCHGANSAFLELTKLGVCTSGAVMVPCPWFLEIAEAVAVDASIDLGVHLTLNAEKSHYKWRPLTAPSQASGLIDPNGFFWPQPALTRAKAHKDAVEAELRAQIDCALQAGIDVTHLDAHMGTAMAPEFCEIFVRLGQEYRLPIMITSTIGTYNPNDNLVGVTEAMHAPGVAAARAAGFQIFDTAVQTTWQRPSTEPIEPAYKSIIQGIGDGLNYFCLHFNAPGELEMIEPEKAYIRTQEYELFKDDAFRAWLSEQELDIIGMRPLRDELRARIPATT